MIRLPMRARTVVMAAGMAAAAAAASIGVASAASADTIPVIPIYQLTTATGSDFLSSPAPDEGAPTYTLMAPRFQYEAWNFAPGTAPAGFQQIYRHYSGGQHFVSTDPAGAEGPLGWLANNPALAEANSGRSCEGKSSPELRVENAATQPVVASDDDKNSSVSTGNVIVSLGFGPCRQAPQD